jgi:hypothetical protein
MAKAHATAKLRQHAHTAERWQQYWGNLQLVHI